MSRLLLGIFVYQINIIMWNNTRATQLLGIKYPIIQGPFGGRFSSAKLVAIVSDLGGMGSFGLNAYGSDDILQIDASIKALTDRPYALNLWVPLKEDPALKYGLQEFQVLKKRFKPYFDRLNVPLPEIPEAESLNFEQQVEAVLKARPPVLSFIFGIPSKEVIQEAKQAGIRTIGTITTLEEALVIEEAGLDLIVASGSQAGGHRASFLQEAEKSLTDTSTLLQQVVPKVRIPVIAAGGISNGKTLVAALKLGASAVQIGTAFLATEESNASLEHKELLLSQEAYTTTLTEVYTGRLARVVANVFTKDEGRRKFDFAPYPIQSTFLSTFIQAARKQGENHFLPFYAGQPSGRLHHESAGNLFKALIEEVSGILREKS